MIERRLQLALEEPPDPLVKDHLWNQAARSAEAVEPAQPDRDMTYLVPIDTAQDLCSISVADLFEPRHHLRGHVEPAGFEHQRHDGETREQVSSSRRGGFPQPVMRRLRRSAGAEFGQPAREQLEMAGLLGRDLDPVVEELPRQPRAGEPGDKIPAEVDRVELNMA